MKNPANVQHIKNYFGKPIVLVIALLSLVPIIMGFVISSIGASALDELMDFAMDLAKQTGSAAEFPMTTGSTGSSMNLTAIAAIVGWFLIYFMSRSKNPETTPAAGLMIFTVLSILGIIGSSLLILVAILILFVGIAAIGGSSYTTGVDGTASSSVSTEFVGGIMIGLFIALLISGIILLLASVFELKFFNAARKSMKSPFLIVAGKGYGVFSVITAIFTFIGVFSLIAFGFYFTGIDKSALDGMFDSTSELTINTGSLVSLLKSLGTLMIISAVSSLAEGISYCLQAKLAFGYCTLAKTTPAQPMNTPYGGGGYGFYGQGNTAPAPQNNNAPTQVYGNNAPIQPDTNENPYADNYGSQQNMNR